jgi:hypothetical protein
MEISGSTLNRLHNQKDVNIPSIAKSPWAKFLMPMTPNIRLMPIAMVAYMLPNITPLTALTSASSKGTLPPLPAAMSFRGRDALGEYNGA